MSRKNKNNKKNANKFTQKGANTIVNTRNTNRNNGPRVVGRTQTVAPSNKNGGGRNVRNWTSYTGTTPALEGTSNSWYKSVLDPAHAREYGCVGVPDENKDPSVVICRRRDGVLSTAWFKNQDAFAFMASKINWSSGVYTQCAWVLCTITNASNITRVNLRQYPQGGVLLEAFGQFVVRSSDLTNSILSTPESGYIECTVDRVIIVVEDGFRADERTYETIDGTTGLVNNSYLQDSGSQCRIISSSLTVSNVTAMVNRGGYFTAGHHPQQIIHPSTSELETVSGASEAEINFLAFEGSLDSYATYSGGPDAGVYVISRPRNVHNMLHWETMDDNVTFHMPVSKQPAAGTLYKRAVGSSGSYTGTPLTAASSISLYGYITDLNVVASGQNQNVAPVFNANCTWKFLNQTLVAWDVNWMSWFPTADNWTIRVTRYYNYEKKLSYDEGGTDGARCDRNAMNLLMGALDHTELTFDHTANDSARVRAVLRKIYKKYGKSIMAAAGTLGAPSFARKAADTLLRGWLDT